MRKLLILTIVLISCTQHHPKNSKSRIELVKDLPYRILNVPQDLKDQLVVTGHRIWEMVDTLDPNFGYLLKVKSNYKVELVKYSQSIDSLRNESYELWRNKDFEFTTLVYQSNSTNTLTQDTSRFFILETEHSNLTGTFYIFVPFDKIWDPKRIKTTYVDRN